MNEGGLSLPLLPPTTAAPFCQERKWPACLSRNQAMAAQQDGNSVCVQGPYFLSLTHSHPLAEKHTSCVHLSSSYHLFSALNNLVILLHALWYSREREREEGPGGIEYLGEGWKKACDETIGGVSLCKGQLWGCHHKYPNGKLSITVILYSVKYT